MKSKTIVLLMMFVAVSSLLSAQGLKVKSGTNIKVETGTTLKISTGNLILESDDSGDATIIVLGDGSVTYGASSSATVKRYLPGLAAAWHMISTPVTGMAIAGNWAPETDEDFFLWHEPSPGIWVNFKNQSSGTSGDLPYFDVANGSNNFATGRGYIVDYNTANPTYDFSGPLKTGNVTITLAKSAAKSWNWSAGWNLIGNPYASGLDWSAVNRDGLGEAFAQVYNPIKEGGAGYDQPSTIASGQGFFVLAASDGATLNLTPTQQVHTTTATFLKEAVAEDDRLVLRLSMGAFYDETKLLINQESLPEHDFWDATKLYSFDPQVPQISTLISGNHPLVINSIPTISASVVIPVSIKVPADGAMTLDLTEFSGAAFEGQKIILHDLLTNTQQTVSENPSYTFQARMSDDANRFLLKFGVVGVPEYRGMPELQAYMSDHLLYILNPGNENAQVELVNLQGQLLLRNQIEPGLQHINTKLSTGIYMVVMRSPMNLATRKIFIP